MYVHTPYGPHVELVRKVFALKNQFRREDKYISFSFKDTARPLTNGGGSSRIKRSKGNASSFFIFF